MLINIRCIGDLRLLGADLGDYFLSEGNQTPRQGPLILSVAWILSSTVQTDLCKVALHTCFKHHNCALKLIQWTPQSVLLRYSA